MSRKIQALINHVPIVLDERVPEGLIIIRGKNEVFAVDVASRTFSPLIEEARPFRPPVPEAMKAKLAAFVEHGLNPGGFLTAVLENNLARAVQAADPDSLGLLVSLVEYLDASVPADAWGSRKKVEAWGRGKLRADRKKGAAYDS